MDEEDREMMFILLGATLLGLLFLLVGRLMG